MRLKFMENLKTTDRSSYPLVALERVVTTAAAGSQDIRSGNLSHRPESRSEDGDRHSSTPGDVESRPQEILKRLQAWHTWEEARHASLTSYFLHSLGLPSRPALPPPEELAEVSNFYYPPLLYRKAFVVDHNGLRGQSTDRSYQEFMLQDLEGWSGDLFSTKVGDPRWIHLPIGQCVLQKHIITEFEQAAKRMNLTTRTHRIRDIDIVSEESVNMRLDVFNLLRDVPHDTWTWKTWLRHSRSFTRAPSSDYIDMLEDSDYFWSRAASDLPRPIGLMLNIKAEHLRKTKGQKIVPPQQLLATHPDYEKSSLIQQELTCIHRSDGSLLTFSTAPDFDSFSIRVQYWGQIDRTWSNNQIAWRRLCEIVGAFLEPRYSPDIEINDAYFQIVQDLKLRRQGRLRRHEATVLVEDHISCMNEISQIVNAKYLVSNIIRKLKSDGPFLELNKELKDLSSTLDAQRQELEELLKELRSSLDVFFQLKTVEQNEIALQAETNNQAILLFTIITTIFLPLSFFTSYFGMNLKGIADTDKDENYFWAVCGSITVSILILTLVFGFKRRLYDSIWTDRSYSKTKHRAWAGDSSSAVPARGPLLQDSTSYVRSSTRQSTTRSSSKA